MPSARRNNKSKPAQQAAAERVDESSGAPRCDSGDVARLAYSYWEARGCQGGSPEEDWLRAERELRIGE